MKYLLDIPEEKALEAENLFRSIDFIEQFRVIAPNEITNSTLLESIESFESGKVLPTPLTLKELKELIDA
jgi:hypothetical protein